MELRKHQIKQNKMASKALKKYDHVIYGAPTGFGKSIAALKLIEKYINKGKRVILLAPRIELVNQLAATCALLNPVVVQGSRKIIGDPKSALLVITIPQTANTRIKNDENFFGDVDYVMVDECHLFFNIVDSIPGDGIKWIHDRYWNKCKWLGFSATPITANGSRLEGWDTSIYKYDTRWLIKKGWLSKFNYFAEDSIDTSAIKIDKKTHDYTASDMNDVVNTASAIDAINTAYFKYCKDKKVIIFAATIEHGKLIVEYMRDYHKIDARIIHSKLTPKQVKETLQEFKRGIYSVIVNVQMLTTGFDDPTVESIILARPIGSVRLAIQIFGRVLRTHDDIPYVDIIDLCGVHKDTVLPDEPINWNKEKYNGENPFDENDGVNKIVQCVHCKGEFKLNERKFERVYKDHIMVLTYMCPQCGQIISENDTQLSIPTEMQKIKTMSDLNLNIQYVPAQVIMEIIREKNLNSFTKDTNPNFAYFMVRSFKQKGRVKLLKELCAAYKQGIYTYEKTWKLLLDVHFEK